jgi:hypothetical protein
MLLSQPQPRREAILIGKIPQPAGGEPARAATLLAALQRQPTGEPGVVEGRVPQPAPANPNSRVPTPRVRTGME